MRYFIDTLRKNIILVSFIYFQYLTYELISDSEWAVSLKRPERCSFKKKKKTFIYQILELVNFYLLYYLS